MFKRRILIGAFVLSMLFSVTAFAETEKDYTMNECWFEENYDAGTIYAEWEKCESSTSYKLAVHRKSLSSSSDELGNIILSRTVSGSSYNLSSLIDGKGTGLYTFTVTPTKQPGADNMATSETIEVDQDYLKLIRNRDKSSDGNNANDTKQPAAKDGWLQVPGGWQYIKDGAAVKNTWLLDGGIWYFLDANGSMLTGWQWIGGCCYYLNPTSGVNGYPQGGCFIGCVTPDGYTVDGSGAWTVDGVVQRK